MKGRRGDGDKSFSKKLENKTRMKWRSPGEKREVKCCAVQSENENGGGENLDGSQSKTKKEKEEKAGGGVEVPPWVKREQMKAAMASKNEMEGDALTKFELPWPLALISSVIVGIAAVGSVFEYIYRNPIFGVVPSTSPLYTPVLIFFAVTGLPTAAVLFKQAVDGANEMASKQDEIDRMM